VFSPLASSPPLTKGATGDFQTGETPDRPVGRGRDDTINPKCEGHSNGSRKKLDKKFFICGILRHHYSSMRRHILKSILDFFVNIPIIIISLEN
jgi:hypothetical protein